MTAALPPLCDWPGGKPMNRRYSRRTGEPAFTYAELNANAEHRCCSCKAAGRPLGNNPADSFQTTPPTRPSVLVPPKHHGMIDLLWDDVNLDALFDD
jgi:hypothetical protein